MGAYQSVLRNGLLDSLTWCALEKSTAICEPENSGEAEPKAPVPKKSSCAGLVPTVEGRMIAGFDQELGARAGETSHSFSAQAIQELLDEP